jgi:glycosyltransferase involved in cell wall biosynthesis
LKIVFISVPTFEPWDWTNPDTQGIGGSETSHIEMAQRLSKAGHEVISYAPVAFEGVRVDPFGVKWSRAENLTCEDNPDLWIIYRHPEAIDHIPDGAPIWLICQDVDYQREGNELNELRASRLTRIVALCETHGAYLRSVHPYAADKVFVSSNGIKTDLIREIAANPPERNLRRLIYASSPDRGMEFLLEIFPRVREMIPDLELHIYYGFNNIEKVVEWAGKHSWVGQNTDRLRQLLEQPGVTFHGRMGQPELLREWFASGIWCHPSNFTETSCITCMDAQACGAIPITAPVWAIAENVKHGVFVEGNVNNQVVQARFALELFKMAVDPDRQEAIRGQMMQWAEHHFDWNRFAWQWETWVDEDTRPKAPAVLRSKPLISLVHTTARIPNRWQHAASEWAAKCDDRSRVEYILSVDKGREAAVDCDEMYRTWNPFRFVQNHGRRCAVDGWNAAAAASRGDLIITVADDYFPPEHWDTQIEKLLSRLNLHSDLEYVLDVDNQDGSDWLLPLSFISRKYYERLGYLFWPQYHGLCGDNDFTEVARRDRVVINARHLKFYQGPTPEGAVLGDEVYNHQRRYWEQGKALFEQRKKEGFPPLPEDAETRWPWFAGQRAPGARAQREAVAC